MNFHYDLENAKHYSSMPEDQDLREIYPIIDFPAQVGSESQFGDFFNLIFDANETIHDQNQKVDEENLPNPSPGDFKWSKPFIIHRKSKQKPPLSSIADQILTCNLPRQENSTKSHGSTLRSHQKSSENIILIKINDTESSYPLKRDSPAGKQLVEYLSILSNQSIDSLGEVCISTMFANKQYYFKLEFEGSNGTLISKKSLPEARREKLHHNIDKNLLEFFTTKTFLKNVKCSGLLKEKLGDIHFSAGMRCDLSEKSRDKKWKTLKEANLDLLAYFKDRFFSQDLENYLFTNLIQNKIKKFQSPKIEKIANLLIKDRLKLAKSEAPEFIGVVEKCLTSAEMNVSKIAGDAVKTLFFSKVYDRFQGEIKAPVNSLAEKLRALFKEVIIEANIFKALWVLADREEILELVERLVRTRVIMNQKKAGVQFEKTDDEDESEEYEREVRPTRLKRVKKH